MGLTCAIEQNVLGFQIGMRHSPLVKIVECWGDIPENALCLYKCEALTRHEPVCGTAFSEIFSGDENAILTFADLEKGSQVDMLEFAVTMLCDAASQGKQAGGLNVFGIEKLRASRPSRAHDKHAQYDSRRVLR